MEITTIRGYRKHLGASLLKIREKKFFTNGMDDFISSSIDPIIQFVDPRCIAGLNHVYHAVRLCLRALSKKRLISKHFRLELLLYLAARRQITESIKILGVNEDSEEILLLGIGASKTRLKVALQNLIPRIGEELPLTLIGVEGIASHRKIMEAFSITGLEIDSTYFKQEEDFKTVLEKLVVERIALFAI